MINPTNFRQGFMGAFANVDSYPDEAIGFWIGIAYLMLPVNRWGPSVESTALPPTALLDYGVMFFVAHQLALEDQSRKAAARGATPGLQTGAIASNSVGPVSRSYNTAAGITADAGHWNLTTYGTRFYELLMMVGMGPVTENGGYPPYGFGGFGGAFAPGPNAPPWIGPPPFPGWFG